MYLEKSCLWAVSGMWVSLRSCGLVELGRGELPTQGAGTHEGEAGPQPQPRLVAAPQLRSQALMVGWDSHLPALL